MTFYLATASLSAAAYFLGPEKTCELIGLAGKATLKAAEVVIPKIWDLSCQAFQHSRTRYSDPHRDPNASLVSTLASDFKGYLKAIGVDLVQRGTAYVKTLPATLRPHIPAKVDQLGTLAYEQYQARQAALALDSVISTIDLARLPNGQLSVLDQILQDSMPAGKLRRLQHQIWEFTQSEQQSLRYLEHMPGTAESQRPQIPPTKEQTKKQIEEMIEATQLDTQGFSGLQLIEDYVHVRDHQGIHAAWIYAKIAAMAGTCNHPAAARFSAELVLGDLDHKAANHDKPSDDALRALGMNLEEYELLNDPTNAYTAMLLADQIHRNANADAHSATFTNYQQTRIAGLPDVMMQQDHLQKDANGGKHSQPAFDYIIQKKRDADNSVPTYGEDLLLPDLDHQRLNNGALSDAIVTEIQTNAGNPLVLHTYTPAVLIQALHAYTSDSGVLSSAANQEIVNNNPDPLDAPFSLPILLNYLNGTPGSRKAAHEAILNNCGITKEQFQNLNCSEALKNRYFESSNKFNTQLERAKELRDSFLREMNFYQAEYTTFITDQTKYKTHYDQFRKDQEKVVNPLDNEKMEEDQRRLASLESFKAVQQHYRPSHQLFFQGRAATAGQNDGIPSYQNVQAAFKTKYKETVADASIFRDKLRAEMADLTQQAQQVQSQISMAHTHKNDSLKTLDAVALQQISSAASSKDLGYITFHQGNFLHGKGETYILSGKDLKKVLTDKSAVHQIMSTTSGSTVRASVVGGRLVADPSGSIKIERVADSEAANPKNVALLRERGFAAMNELTQALVRNAGGEISPTTYQKALDAIQKGLESKDSVYKERKTWFENYVRPKLDEIITEDQRHSIATGAVLQKQLRLASDTKQKEKFEPLSLACKTFTENIDELHTKLDKMFWKNTSEKQLLANLNAMKTAAEEIRDIIKKNAATAQAMATGIAPQLQSFYRAAQEVHTLLAANPSKQAQVAQDVSSVRANAKAAFDFIAQTRPFTKELAKELTQKVETTPTLSAAAAVDGVLDSVSRGARQFLRAVKPAHLHQ